MPLFEMKEHYENEGQEWKAPTFKDCAKRDITEVFFNELEHADLRTIDGGKQVPVIIEEEDVREHSSHWEAGAKQNFDTGLYTAHTILYIKAEDYGPKPKVGKEIVVGFEKGVRRTYIIRKCEDEAGVYRMAMQRKRQ